MLGIDPGTAICGFAVVRAGKDHRAVLVECGVIRTSVSDGLPMRLLSISEALDDLVSRHRPDVAAIEDVFHGRNARSALVLGHARGVAMLAAARHGVRVAEITPAEVKRAIGGSGRATKPQLALTVTRLLRLAAPPRPADAADGVAIALAQLVRIAPRTRFAGAAG
ncbi:MAG TPA: crossover junction endodeoxyribonuclease RuvC [Gemmatimonadales bacterium]|nr:crossover junction endodeoxyribonuclease RuvC [Gemmatimonadales bacterium]